jgi:hypothetical protein
MIWPGDVTRNGKIRTAYTILERKPEGKRQLGKLRRRCEDNI